MREGGAIVRYLVVLGTLVIALSFHKGTFGRLVAFMALMSWWSAV